MKPWLGLALVLVVGCASQGNFESDLRNPAYYGGGNRILLPGVIESLSGSDNSNTAQNYAVGSAVAGLVTSGLTLALNREYYRSNYLAGYVLCGTGLTGMDYPCRGVAVILKDRHGKELSRLMADDGEFVFHVADEREYFVSAESPHFSLPSEIGPISKGENVVLHLQPKVN